MNPNRKLRDDYKQSFVPIGIYAIRNTVNQRVLIGGSRNLHGAMNRHRFELANGSHRNTALLADWQRFGAEAFCFEVLDQVPYSADPGMDYDAELASLLALWIDERTGSGQPSYSQPASSNVRAVSNLLQSPAAVVQEIKDPP